MLEKEINIDYCWSMNRIIFDKTVSEDPVTFAFVTLPEKEVMQVPEKGNAGLNLVINILIIIQYFDPQYQ